MGSTHHASFFSLGTWLIAIGGAFLFLFLFDLATNRKTGGHAATR